MNALGQLIQGEPKTDGIRRGVGELAEAVEETEGVEHGGVDAHAHGGIAGLDALQGGSAGERAIGDDASGQAAAPPGVADVTTELAQGAANGGRRTVGSGHGVIFVRHTGR